MVCSCCRTECAYNYTVSSKINNALCVLRIDNGRFGAQPEFAAGRLEFELDDDAALNQNRNFLVDFDPYPERVQCVEYNGLWTNYKIEPITVGYPAT
jgi:hypothetical protein